MDGQCMYMYTNTHGCTYTHVHKHACTCYVHARRLYTQKCMQYLYTFMCVHMGVHIHMFVFRYVSLVCAHVHILFYRDVTPHHKCGSWKSCLCEEPEAHRAGDGEGQVDVRWKVEGGRRIRTL